VEVKPPSEGDEGTVVFLTASFIVLVMIYVFAFEHYGAGELRGEQSAQATILPFQVLFRDLPSTEQRVFRTLQEGAVEALRVRGDTGAWPTAAALAAEGIPPFAPDPLDDAGRRWTLRRDGLVSNYLGVPGTAGAGPAFLILVQEPDPIFGEKAAAGVVDEEHQRLADGTLLHVTYWMRAAAPTGPGIIADPALGGWRQIRVRTLFEELEESS